MTSPLFILYGSATGNAEHIAKELASRANDQISSYGFDSVVCCELDQFKKKCQSTWEQEPPCGEKYGLLIVTSTTGNGEAPENASRFVRYIKRKTTVASQPFRNVAYCVLGLGDTNYDQFCNCGKVVDQKLSLLGGTRVQALTCADEATGLEDVVEPWTENILVTLSPACCWNQQQQETPLSGSVSDEEKKLDPLDHTASTPVETSVSTESSSSALAKGPSPAVKASVSTASSTSPGVETIRALLNLNESASVWEVDHSKLPGLASSLSSCALIDTNDNDNEIAQRPRGLSSADTHSTTSSSGFHFTIRRPYESTILGARYLTQTSTDAARRVVAEMSSNVLTKDERLQRAYDIYDEQFDLDRERNGKRVLELTLSLPDDYTLEYAPGDSLGLLVENTPQTISFCLDMLHRHHGIGPDQKISIDEEHPITVEEAIRSQIDLCSPVKAKRTLLSLSQFATDPEEICALQLLASKTPQGEELFCKLVDGQKWSVLDLLKEFPSLQRISIESLLSILPGIPPRYYSVSSSPLEEHNHQRRLSLTVAFSVVDYTTPSLLVHSHERGHKRIRGVATRYLEALCSPLLVDGSSSSSVNIPKLRIFPKPTTDFRMPDLSVPLILIGPGTGIAPFVGFLSHRRALLASSESTNAAQTIVQGTWRGGYDLEEDELPVHKHDASGLRVGLDYRTTQQNVGSVDLFFGCRHKDHDWLYRTELQALEQEGILTRLYTAFSRDGAQRQYVQDIMRNNEDCASRLVNLILEERASVFVCGDGNAMGKDVQAAIVELLSRRMTTDQAKAYLEAMKTNKRFLMDIWS